MIKVITLGLAMVAFKGIESRRNDPRSHTLGWWPSNGERLCRMTAKGV